MLITLRGQRVNHGLALRNLIILSTFLPNNSDYNE